MSRRHESGQTTTEYLMIAGLITSVFIVVSGTTERPFHEMMRDLLQCIADGTTNQQRCEQATATNVRASAAATMPSPSQMVQNGASVQAVQHVLQEQFDDLLPSRPGPPPGRGGGSSGGSSGSSGPIDATSASSAAANSIPRGTGTPLNSHRYESKTGASGAYYRKVESKANTQTTGISGVVTLPKFQVDPTRINDDEKLGKTGPMDRPSIYLGAHTDTTIGDTAVSAEADIGLQYTRRYDSQGRETFVPAEMQQNGTRPTDGQLYYRGDDGNYYNQRGEKFEGDPKTLVPHYTYTPFARLNEPVLKNGKPVVDGDGKVKYENRYLDIDDKEDQSRYFYPGERVEMKVERQIGGEPNVLFSVHRDGESPKQYGINSVLLGRGDSNVSVKKVTSIDQYVWENGKVVSAESRKPPQVDPTNAHLNGAIWERTSVWEGSNATPMTGPGFTEIVPRDPGNQVDEGGTFHIGDPTSRGGERIDITPTRPKSGR